MLATSGRVPLALAGGDCHIRCRGGEEAAVLDDLMIAASIAAIGLIGTGAVARADDAGPAPELDRLIERFEAGAPKTEATSARVLTPFLMEERSPWLTSSP